MTYRPQSEPKHSSKRPYFTPEQLLTSDQLNQAQVFQIANLQRALHALAGSGVVYGFELSCDLKKHRDNTSEQLKKGSIFIGCGLAFDDHGRQLYWPGGYLNISDIVGNQPNAPGEYTLSVHYAERRINRPRNIDECGGYTSDEKHILWIEPSVVFTLTKGCTKKPNDCFNRQEKCLNTNDYVCEQLEQVPCYQEPKKLCSAGSNCENVYYDSEYGVPLACVHIENLSQNPDHCGSSYGFCGQNKPEICSYRPYVYRNKLLYDLIRGDHRNYARVERLSWQDWVLYNKDWEASVSWKEFRERVDNDGFIITFSRPIQTLTLHPGSIILSTVVQEARTDYWEERRIPLKIIPVNPVTKGAYRYAQSVKLEFDGNWRTSEIDDLRSTLEYGMIVELTIRGALLRDECGCMLDARPLGYEKPEQSCCQSLPGGDFIALFRVEPKGEKIAPEYRKTSPEAAE
jgi:hypothetical protein